MPEASSRIFCRPRYAKVTAITLRNTRELPKHGLVKALSKSKERVKDIFTRAKVRVIIKHVNGAEEVLEKETNHDEEEVVINYSWYASSLLIRIVTCSSSHSFVQLESDETKLYIDWSGRSKRSDQLRPIILHIPRRCEGGSISLTDKGECGTVLFIVGLDIT